MPLWSRGGVLGAPPARPSVDRKIEGYTHQLILETKGPCIGCEEKPGDPRCPFPGCHGGQHTWELPWGGHFREGSSWLGITVRFPKLQALGK